MLSKLVLWTWLFAFSRPGSPVLRGGGPSSIATGITHEPSLSYAQINLPLSRFPGSWAGTRKLSVNCSCSIGYPISTDIRYSCHFDGDFASIPRDVKYWSKGNPVAVTPPLRERRIGLFEKLFKYAYGRQTCMWMAWKERSPHIRTLCL